jgi:hypothetical protein
MLVNNAACGETAGAFVLYMGMAIVVYAIIANRRAKQWEMLSGVEC